MMPSIGLLAELHRDASWKPDASRTPIEHLVEYLLTGSLASNAPAGIEELTERVLQFDPTGTRVVVLGGGTGLSTIIGGNSQMPEWPEQPFVGLKEEYPLLDVIVCTTDDGGSTGRFLKSLPMIGIGDLRKLLISSIRSNNLEKKYGLEQPSQGGLIRFIHALFNYRFPGDRQIDAEQLRDPLLVVGQELRSGCPGPLAASLRRLGEYISPGGEGPLIDPTGHSMGNLLLVSAIFMAAQGDSSQAPTLGDIQKGVDLIAELIGALPGIIHAATATPGQLKFRYANGVEVYGQSKSAQTDRDSPVERVVAEFVDQPIVGDEILSAIAAADLIIYAPGSLYTSIIPILQLEPITDAIRANRKALKVLGANSWMQKGETDISLKHQGRGFLVSELIEAYDRNVPSGIEGLFDVVLSANLEHVPGNILRNYALEGKSPIHLDREPVEELGLRPVEATLFSSEHWERAQVIHHDPRRFVLAVRTLLFADTCLKQQQGYALRKVPARKQTAATRFTGARRKGILLCDYLKSVKEALQEKVFRPPELRDFLLEVAWNNREIRPAHLEFFEGVVVIDSRSWNRNTEWDNILGYYDPGDRYIKLHEDLLASRSRTSEDLLVALGESLLGEYIGKRRWIASHGARTYEIVLKPPQERNCFLQDAQLHTYLKLARMTQDQTDSLTYRITINDDEGFLPPGLLFGLLYSWYLTGSGLTMEYEMSLLRWPVKSLIPLHAKDRVRKENLVTFFRSQIFGHTD